jgi:hypothetical protein
VAQTSKAATERKRPRSRKRPRQDAFASYVIAIDDWEWSLSFGIDQTRFREGPYMDFRHLHLRGKLLIPSRIKAETAQAILMPDRTATYARSDAPEPKGVGSASLYHGRFEALLTIPDDALASVLQMLIADKFRFIEMHGERMRYRSAAIRSYRLEMNIEEEDMPTDI